MCISLKDGETGFSEASKKVGWPSDGVFVWGSFLAELIYHQSGRQRDGTEKGRLKYMNTRKKTNLKGREQSTKAKARDESMIDQRATQENERNTPLRLKKYYNEGRHSRPRTAGGSSTTDRHTSKFGLPRGHSKWQIKRGFVEEVMTVRHYLRVDTIRSSCKAQVGSIVLYWVCGWREESVERKAKTEGMRDGARAGWGLHTAGMERWAGEEGGEEGGDAGCSSENTSRVDPSDRAVPWWIRARGCRRNRGGRCAATVARGGRENGRSGGGCDPEARAGRRCRGDVACPPDARGRDSGEARRRQGGARAAAGAGRAAGEGCRHRVVAVDAAAGADRRRRSGGGTRVSQQKRRRCGYCGAVLLKQNWPPVPTRKLARVWVWERGSTAGRMRGGTVVPTRRGVGRGGRSWRRDGMGGETHRRVARQAVRTQDWIGVPVPRRVRGGQRGDRARACTEGGQGVHGREVQVWMRIGTSVVETDTRVRVEAGQNGRGSAWGERCGRGARRACGEGAREGTGVAAHGRGARQRCGRGAAVERTADARADDGAEWHGVRVVAGAGTGNALEHRERQRGCGGWERMAAEVGVKLVFGCGRGRRDEWLHHGGEYKLHGWNAKEEGNLREGWMRECGSRTSLRLKLRVTSRVRRTLSAGAAHQSGLTAKKDVVRLAQVFTRVLIQDSSSEVVHAAKTKRNTTRDGGRKNCVKFNLKESVQPHPSIYFSFLNFKISSTIKSLLTVVKAKRPAGDLAHLSLEQTNS
ncbi:hypothetical protein B0H14DRAFT_3727696 [Mycena olivaceomarginata]|nr:hypothetical protein B0H14DRAFT_3727696 [Mycena olivaceomarginata]